jgi:hypothetical protein
MKKRKKSKTTVVEEEIEDEEVYGELDEGGAGKDKRYILFNVANFSLQ